MVTFTQVAGWEESHGSITLRAPHSLSIYALPPILKQLQRHCPKVRLDKEVAAGDLLLLPWVEQELETAILMIRHKDKWVSPALQVFMEQVRESFR
jgi:DNA-binding transcriptional LysR family regulator